MLPGWQCRGEEGRSRHRSQDGSDMKMLITGENADFDE